MKYETLTEGEGSTFTGRVRVTAEPNDELTTRGIDGLEVEITEGPKVEGQTEASRVANVYDKGNVHVAAFVVQPPEEREQSELERQVDVAIKQYLQTRPR